MSQTSTDTSAQGNNNFSVFLENLLEMCLLAAIIIVPLFNNAFSILPFEEAKVPLFRSISVLSLPFFIYLLFKLRNDPHTPSESIWKNPLVLPAFLVAYAYMASTAFSVSPIGSFFGVYLRRQGAYVNFCYILLFFVILRVIVTRQKVDRLIFAFLIAGMTSASWGIFQRFGLDANPWATSNFQGRVWSTHGNPVFLSAFLVMVLPFHLYFFNRAWQALKKGKLAKLPIKDNLGHAGLLVFLIISAAAHLLAIYFTRSRGPLLGLVAGLMFLAMLTFVNRKLAKAITALIVAGGLALVVLIMIAPDAGQPASTSILTKLSSPFTQGSGLVRVHIWKGVITALTSEPKRLLTGFGPETMFLIIPKYNSPLLQYIESSVAIADRAHNEMLDLLIMQGIAGLAAFIFLFGAACRHLLKLLGMISSKKQELLFAASFLACGLLGWGFSYLKTGQSIYLGLGITFGLLFGMALYIIVHIWTVDRSAEPRHPDHILLIVIFAAIISHLVEIQTGFGVTATRLYFWAILGIAATVGKGYVTDKEQKLELGRFGRLSMTTLATANMAVFMIMVTVFSFIWMGLTLSSVRPVLLVFQLFMLASIGLFLMSSLKNQDYDLGGQIRGITFALGLAIILGGLYYFSYLVAEKWAAKILIGLLKNPIRSVTEKIVMLGSFHGWIFFLILAGAFLSVIPLMEKGRRLSSIKKFWVFPLLALMTLPAVISPNFKGPMADINTKAGDEFMKAKRWGAAERTLSRAVELEPKMPWRYQKLGHLYYARAKMEKQPKKDKLFEKAMFNVDKAEHLEPMNVHFGNNLARISFNWASAIKDPKQRFHRLKLTETFYSRAIKTDPNNSFLWKEWGKIAADLGGFDRAARRFSRALELHPKDVNSLASLALIYQKQKKYKKALKKAEEAWALAKGKNKMKLQKLIADLRMAIEKPRRRR